jgi:GMP synthase (glutamine-hydrolysing)
MAARAPRPLVLVVMHDWLAPAGLLGEELIDAGVAYMTVVPHQGYGSAAPAGRVALPDDHRGHDGLLLLGGAMAACDEAGYPHLRDLLGLIRSFHDAGKPVLGVCLGAQLIARAFGARVAPQGFVEFGFAPLHLTPAGRREPLLSGVSAEPRLVQWHEDAFELPPGAELLLRGHECHNQGFRLGDRTFGFQCHLEVTADIARSWVWLRRHEIATGDPTFFARFEADLADHMAGAMSFGRIVGRRFARLVRAGPDKNFRAL